jgi:protoporphyrinogen/coproporphyrinogen III oxidase
MNGALRRPEVLTSPEVVVVGAGIAGLTAAFRLQQAGLKVTVLERAECVGGRVRTTDHDGFRIDRGASVLFTCYDEIVSLIADAGLTHQVLECSDLAGIVKADRTVRFHTASRLGLPLVRSLPPRALLPLLRLSAATARNSGRLDWKVTPAAVRLDTADVRNETRRRSADLAEGVLDPLIRGFTMRETDEVSSVQMYFVLTKLLGTRWLNSGNGMRFLPEGLARQLDVRTLTEVTGIVEGSRGVTVTARPARGPELVLEAEAVVVATPPPQALPLLPAAGRERRELLAAFKHIPAVVVHLGLDRPPREPAAWLSLQREHYGALNSVVLEHHKAPERVPPGRGLVSFYWHGDWSAEHFADDDEQLVKHGMQEADRLFPGISDQACLAQVSRWPFALGAYPTGTFPLLRRFASCEPHSRIRFASDFLGVCGATNTSAVMGAKAAEEIVARLGQPGPRPLDPSRRRMK